MCFEHGTYNENEKKSCLKSVNIFRTSTEEESLVKFMFKVINGGSMYE